MYSFGGVWKAPIDAGRDGEAGGAMRELTNVTCIEDLRTIARRKVPRAFFDYAEAGSYSEQTLRANRAGLEAINLRQRVLIDVSARDTVTTILGEPVSAPL